MIFSFFVEIRPPRLGVTGRVGIEMGSILWSRQLTPKGISFTANLPLLFKMQTQFFIKARMKFWHASFLFSFLLYLLTSQFLGMKFVASMLVSLAPLHFTCTASFAFQKWNLGLWKWLSFGIPARLFSKIYYFCCTSNFSWTCSPLSLKNLNNY